MATYTLHLGFNWNSPVIGSFWAEPTSQRFLQYALADENGAPAWFRFEEGDLLAIELWDLTQAATAGAADLAMSASLSFAPLDAGDASTYAPSTLVETRGNTQEATREVNGKVQPYLSLGAVASLAGRDSPWGPARGHWVAGGLSFSTQLGYKLSFFLRAALAGSTIPPRDYLSDPEVIVGPRGG